MRSDAAAPAADTVTATSEVGASVRTMSYVEASDPSPTTSTVSDNDTRGLRQRTALGSNRALALEQEHVSLAATAELPPGQKMHAAEEFPGACLNVPAGHSAHAPACSKRPAPQSAAFAETASSTAPISARSTSAPRILAALAPAPQGALRRAAPAVSTPAHGEARKQTGVGWVVCACSDHAGPQCARARVQRQLPNSWQTRTRQSKQRGRVPPCDDAPRRWLQRAQRSNCWAAAPLALACLTQVTRAESGASGPLVQQTAGRCASWAPSRVPGLPRGAVFSQRRRRRETASTPQSVAGSASKTQPLGCACPAPHKLAKPGLAGAKACPVGPAQHLLPEGDLIDAREGCERASRSSPG